MSIQASISNLFETKQKRKTLNIYESIIKPVIRTLTAPLLGIIIFLFIWTISAANIHTSLGEFPGPSAALKQGAVLWQEHKESGIKESAFYQRQEQKNAQRIALQPDYVAKVRPYTGAPDFIDQISTSLLTVMAGFALSSLIAIPFGIIIGLNSMLHAASNPIIQIFKPVSPLAWLPLVTMVVSALYISDDPLLPKSFVTSVITVTLCSLWPTLINTAVGVATIDDDLKNVSKVLRLGWFSHVKKIVIPSATPMIFTGLRLSLSTAWMVLIAAEMLSQNPGLGKFVWDEFQNGSSSSLARIMFAVLTIGVIGFVLDRIMLALQRYASWDKNSSSL
ncbi:Bicarbonate transport system permease protein CmpB [Sinobacterium norvegicum]|uniref:Bicarbonate transport system permease protein CmpB n=1 Tax=Sinobacterium norvegicum TaxID=1641715 RepID=A0ABN8EGK2_9GAMM|nr:ABC transporter permease [Sinobacterium norvegicum]CAH0991581.1 Bicarbonate transport system permease protein CmpB [Sinobacterium norvegicum]